MSVASTETVTFADLVVTYALVSPTGQAVCVCEITSHHLVLSCCCFLGDNWFQIIWLYCGCVNV